MELPFSGIVLVKWAVVDYASGEVTVEIRPGVLFAFQIDCMVLFICPGIILLRREIKMQAYASHFEKIPVAGR